MNKQVLIFIAASMLLMLSGCAAKVNLRADQSMLPRLNAEGTPLEIQVHDKRGTNMVARTNSGLSITLPTPPATALHEGLTKALASSGFDINGTDPLQLVVDLHYLGASWVAGFGVDVDVKISMRASLYDPQGDKILSKHVDASLHDTAFGGGPPALGVAKELIQQCFNLSIQKLLTNRKLVAALEAPYESYRSKPTPAVAAAPAPVRVQPITSMSPPAAASNVPLGSIGKRFAVVVGISKYKDSNIPALQYGARDAQAVYDWMIGPGQYAPGDVLLLLNEQATAQNIRDALFNWLKRALEEDVVTIYFAGHGSPDSPDSTGNMYLLPYDTDYTNIAATGFPMWDIQTAFKRFIKAKRAVVIADACHSGGIGQSFAIARRSARGLFVNPVEKALNELSNVGAGVCVISASSSNQLSQEGPQWGGGHGVFTHHLLEGLKGAADYDRNSTVSLGELIPYLSQQVRRETMSRQSPSVAGQFDPALSLGY